MNDREFVRVIRRDVIEENLKYYTGLMESNRSTSGGLDDLTILYRVLPLEMREILVRVVKRIEVDTVSNVLGILDGSSARPDYRGDFSLRYEDGQNMTGDLQDTFLSSE